MRVAALVSLVVLSFTTAAGCSEESSGTSGTTSGSGTGTGGAGTGTGTGGAGTGTGTGGAGTGTGGNATGGGGAGGQPQVTYDCSPPTGVVPALKITPVAVGLQRPVLAISPPGDTSRLFILEQHAGRIRIVENGQLLPTPFLDVDVLIRKNNEEGLLGLAFHPNYAQNGRFFIHYSAAGNGDSTIMEYKISADPNVADATPVQLVLRHPTAQSNHNGGMIEFGKDGYFYIAFGDGGGSNDPECDAQSPANLLGKIIRLDVNAAPAADGYPAAPGNPDGAKYYHIGLRNPWRTAFDPCTGDLYIGDVGQGAWEEVDVVHQADGPQNFGWPYREGAHNHAQSCPAGAPAGLIEPVAEYSHGEGCSITGGFVYRGSAIPSLRGTYFYADYCTHLVRTFRWDGAQSMQDITDLTGDLAVPDDISSFGQDASGELYICAFNGVVFRVEPE